MQDPNADTEWNDVLRHHGIIPQKKEAEITEDEIVKVLDQTVEKNYKGKIPYHTIPYHVLFAALIEVC